MCTDTAVLFNLLSAFAKRAILLLWNLCHTIISAHSSLWPLPIVCSVVYMRARVQNIRFDWSWKHWYEDASMKATVSAVDKKTNTHNIFDQMKKAGINGKNRNQTKTNEKKQERKKDEENKMQQMKRNHQYE